MALNDFLSLYESGLINDLDFKLADFMTELSEESGSEEFRLACAMLSHSCSKKKYICLDISKESEKPIINFFSDKIEEKNKSSVTAITPKTEIWREKILKAKAAGKPFEYKPVILDEDNRLYFYRYWKYENELACSIIQRLKYKNNNINTETLKQGLKKYFKLSPDATDWQKIAACSAVLNNFTIITGGPGTGKTYTVTNILGLLSDQNQNMKVSLCAPTGKAAVRLQESIQKAASELHYDTDIKDLIPDQAMTIHRLLGVKLNSPYFIYNKNNKLPIDVLIIDEASMISLDLMSKLLQAVPENAKIIMLGDKDQLSSVEAGSVLGDICNACGVNNFSNEFKRQYENLSGEIPDTNSAFNGLKDCIIELQHSYRFDSSSKLGSVAKKINEGDFQGVSSAINKKDDNSFIKENLPAQEVLKETLKKIVSEFYNSIFSANTIQDAINVFENFRVLCSHRQGPFGVENINSIIKEILHDFNLINKKENYYKGRPIIIKNNNYSMKLFNGDIGMVWEDGAGVKKVYFQNENKNFRCFSPARIPDHETAFAMSIHKSQGSEFNHLLIILPEFQSPLFTRELVYTGVTRAKKSVRLWINDNILKYSVNNRVKRTSGLQARLIKSISENRGK